MPKVNFITFSEWVGTDYLFSQYPINLSLQFFFCGLSFIR
nr:MAG TPA: hypothetical protein [Caudoviricetes sp.]